MIVSLLSRYVGRRIKDCADEITQTAQHYGYTVNVMDPEFNSSNIMADPHRLNVHLNSNSEIISFTVG